jgi:serine/threonine-protein kinase
VIANRYELIEQIGTGGMASVWRATDTLLGRTVAVKRLLPYLAMEPGAAERFKREAQAAAGLSHPGIVTVFDTGEDEEGPFIILELIEGETLAARLEAGPLNPALVVDIVSQVGSALDHAHGLGVVHRDIKPANLILDPDGRVRLADFGIAKTVDDPTSITATGELVGTISYMAPELLEGAPSVPASDIYSLAAITYEMLAGTPPFSAETPAAMIEAVRRAAPSSLRGMASDEMAAAVTAGMSKDPAQRPPSAGEFASGLIGAATLVLGSDGLGAARNQLGLPSSLIGSQEPTVVTSRPPPASLSPATEPVSAAAGRPRWPLLLVLLGVLAMAAAAMANDPNPAGSSGSLADPAAAETTTTAPATTTTNAPTTSTTTTTTIPTTTTSLVDTPESVADEIESLLAALQPPQFQRRDVRRVEDRLEQVMEDWESDDREELMRELERSFEAVGDLDQSTERDQLHQLFIQLAELMGFEVDQDGQDGEDDDD